MLRTRASGFGDIVLWNCAAGEGTKSMLFTSFVFPLILGAYEEARTRQ